MIAVQPISNSNSSIKLRLTQMHALGWKDIPNSLDDILLVDLWITWDDNDKNEGEISRGIIGSKLRSNMQRTFSFSYYYYSWRARGGREKKEVRLLCQLAFHLYINNVMYRSAYDLMAVFFKAWSSCFTWTKIAPFSCSIGETIVVKGVCPPWPLQISHWPICRWGSSFEEGTTTFWPLLPLNR